MLLSLFLMEIEITCLLKQDPNWWSRNTKWNLLTSVLVSFSNKLMLNDWNWRTPITDTLNLDDTKCDYKKNQLWKKKLFEILKIRSMHEMEEMKRAQELRVDEISQCKILQKIMRQYKNPLRSCRKFKDRWILRMIQENFKKWSRITVEFFHTFPVNLQGFQVHALCLAATNACHLTHGIDLDHRDVFANPRPTLESSQTHHRGSHQFATPSAAGEAPAFKSTKRLVAREEERNELETQSQWRHLHEGRRPWDPLVLWVFHRVLWFGQ